MNERTNLFGSHPTITMIGMKYDGLGRARGSILLIIVGGAASISIVGSSIVE